MNRIDIIYFDAGSGHRSAAKGLERALVGLRPDWRVRMINIVDVFAPNKQFHRIVKAGIGYFNWFLKREKVFDLKGLIDVSFMFHDLLSPRGIKEISRFWAADPPDAVVSVTPMYNPALYRSVRLINSRAVCMTIPVDFEEVKPRYWFTPKVEQHYFVATDRLEEQARTVGIPDSFIHRIPGMPIDPGFYDAARFSQMDKARELERLGLDPAAPTGVVSFGGQGSVLLLEVARGLARVGLNLNLIFLCGKHAAVCEELTHLQAPYRKLALGYSKETPIYYQRLADFVVGKPGSMTITEALASKIPLIAVKSRGMQPVQRENERWLHSSGVGRLVDRRRLDRELAPAVREILASSRYRENAERKFHRGVFDAADLILRLSAQSVPAGPKNFSLV